MPGRVVAVEGPSAAGKTRAVGAVARRLGGAPLAEAYDRVRPRLPLRWKNPGALLRLERTLLAEDARRYREARDLAEAGGIVVTDTGFLGPLTYTTGLVLQGDAPRRVLTALVRTARDLASRGQWGLPDAILYLETPEAERARRARRDPVGHPVDLRERHERVATEERRLYTMVLAPAFGPRFRSVSGRGLPASVARRLATSATGVARVRGPAPRVGKILDALLTSEGVP